MPAPTTEIDVTSAGWTLVVPVGAKGLITGFSGSNMKVRKADSTPAATVESGHPLGVNESLNVDLSDAAETGNLYARVLGTDSNIQSKAVVVFTEA